MPHHSNRPTNTTASAVENTDTQGLFGSRTDILLLGAGAFFLLINIVVFLGIDTKPNAWLYYLDIRHWGISIPLSATLWAIVLWLAAESTDTFEDYLPTIRMFTAIGVMLAIAFILQNSFSTQSSSKNAFWYSLFIIAAICCAVRSLFLLYNYWYEGGENIDMEEAQWFWGLSGFLFGTLLIIGLASIIYIKIPIGGAGDFRYMPLLTHCRNALEILLRNGSGSFAIRTLGFLIFTLSIAFIYVAGKWALIFVARIRGE